MKNKKNPYEETDSTGQEIPIFLNKSSLALFLNL